MIAELFLIGALALPPVGFFRPPLTPADRAFFDFVQQIAVGHLVFLHKTASWEQITKRVFEMPPGTIFFIDQEFGKLHNYFKGRDFEYFPMHWRGYSIYRKRGSSSA